MSAVRAAARRHAGLDQVADPRRRARLAALLPYVSLRAVRGLDWPEGPIARVTGADVDHQVLYEARLSWRLDHLVYEPAEPRLDGVVRAARRARAAVDDEATTRYFRWRRATLAVVAAGEAGDADGDPAAADLARLALDADEAFARLDALTGGWLAGRPGCRP